MDIRKVQLFIFLFMLLPIGSFAEPRDSADPCSLPLLCSNEGIPLLRGNFIHFDGQESQPVKEATLAINFSSPSLRLIFVEFFNNRSKGKRFHYTIKPCDVIQSFEKNDLFGFIYGYPHPTIGLSRKQYKDYQSPLVDESFIRDMPSENLDFQSITCWPEGRASHVSASIISATYREGESSKALFYYVIFPNGWFQGVPAPTAP